mgnify:CR=1 FL=1
MNTVFKWFNDRLPIVNTFERHLSKHPVPKKVNFWYLFGALASVVLIIQIISGIWLMMPYQNTEEGAFSSIEFIMRDVDYGWVIRYMHTTGASMFFAVVYLHMFRGLLYGSYKKPRELVWIFGMTIFDNIDYLTSKIMLPLGGLLMALFAGFIMKRAIVISELNSNIILANIWFILLKIFSPILLIIIFVNGII